MTRGITKSWSTHSEELVLRATDPQPGRVPRVFYTEISNTPYRENAALVKLNGVDWYMPQDMAIRFLDTLTRADVPVWSSHAWPDCPAAPTCIGVVWMIRAGFSVMAGQKVFTWMELYVMVDENTCPVGGGWSFCLMPSAGCMHIPGYVDEVSFTTEPRITSCTVVNGTMRPPQTSKSSANFSLVCSESQQGDPDQTNSRNMATLAPKTTPAPNAAEATAAATPNDGLFSVPGAPADATVEQLRAELAVARGYLTSFTEPGVPQAMSFFAQTKSDQYDAAAIAGMPETLTGNEALAFAGLVVKSALDLHTGKTGLAPVGKNFEQFFSYTAKTRRTATGPATTSVDLVDPCGKSIAPGAFSATPVKQQASGTSRTFFEMFDKV